MEKIEIALAANGPYFCGLFVTACSIAKYAARDVILSYHILDGGIADDDWRLLQVKLSELHPHVRIHMIPVDEELFKDYPAWHGNKMAYARLMLPNTLKDVKWCIYCDVDFTWLRDISELWGERDDRYAFIGTKDGVAATIVSEEKWFKSKGLPFDREKYFCSGLCFMNLAAFRAQDLTGRVFEFIAKYPDVHFPDQAALNYVVRNRLKIVSQRWQRFPMALTQDEINEGVVIHHAGDVPWKPLNGLRILSDAMLIWHVINARCRGCSVWESLRTYYGVFDIVAHRTYCYLFRWFPTRWMLRLLIAGIMRRRKTYDNYRCITDEKVLMWH